MSSAPSTSSHSNGNGYQSSQPESEATYSTEDGAMNGGYSQPSRNDIIISHIYDVGFQTGSYSDTILHVHHTTYRLHAILLSRSPFLAHIMATAPPPQLGSQRVIYVHLDAEPEITPDGFGIALRYLYSPSAALTLVHASNARGVLAASSLLGGMNELCQYAYEACIQSITLESIQSWTTWAATSQDDGNSPQPSIFGEYAQKLRDAVFEFLVKLPGTVDTLQQPSEAQNGRQILLDTFSHVPFDMFKAIIQTPALNIGSDQARFKFARECIALRAKNGFRGETVVLKFAGENGGSAVHVTRKKKRALWKVSDDADS